MGANHSLSSSMGLSESVLDLKFTATPRLIILSPWFEIYILTKVDYIELTHHFVNMSQFNLLTPLGTLSYLLNKFQKLSVEGGGSPGRGGGMEASLSVALVSSMTILHTVVIM